MCIPESVRWGVCASAISSLTSRWFSESVPWRVCVTARPNLPYIVRFGPYRPQGFVPCDASSLVSLMPQNAYDKLATSTLNKVSYHSLTRRCGILQCNVNTEKNIYIYIYNVFMHTPNTLTYFEFPLFFFKKETNIWSLKKMCFSMDFLNTKIIFCILDFTTCL